MSIYDALETRLKQASIDRDTEVVDLLKLIKSQILLEVKTSQLDQPTDDLVLLSIRRQIKKIKESIESYQSNSDDKRLNQAQLDLKLLESFIPQQLDSDQLELKIDEFLKTTDIDLEFKNFKKLLEAIYDQLKPQAVQSDIAQILKVKISK